MVCGLFNPSWEEQVFQFTVVNLKPVSIPPSLITSIAALSLTKNEQDRVKDRLKQAGVRMQEVSIMSLVAYDESSPFVDLIDMAVGSPRQRMARLGYGSMRRIAKEWFNGTRTSLAQIAKSIFDTPSLRIARSKWRDHSACPPWFDFFREFWNSVRTYYPSDLWTKGNSRLFIGAHLWALQEAILAEADSQIASTWRIPGVPEKVTPEEATAYRQAQLRERMREVVAENIKYFPAEMWKVQWAKDSQDTGPGRQDLLDLFKRFISEGKKNGEAWKNWRGNEWFKVKAGKK